MKFKNPKTLKEFSSKIFHIYVDNNFILNQNQMVSKYFYYDYQIINNVWLSETLKIGN